MPMSAYRLVSPLVLILAVAVAATARGQTPDDAVTMLASSSFRTRAAGVALLNTIPASALPPAAPPALMSLLEREATGQVQYNEITADGDESWQEYIVDLSAAVLRLRDARSLRGLALLGIETSRSAQEFVASLGAAALPALNEAWRAKPTVRPDVILTWGSALAVTGNSALSPADRLAVLAHLESATELYSLAVAGAAGRARLVILAPILNQIGDTTSDVIVRARLQRVSTDLRTQLALTPPVDVLSQLRAWLGGICLDARGPRNGDCTALQQLLENAAARLRAGEGGAARATLTAARQRVETARRAGTFSGVEAVTLSLDLEYLLGKI